ncbi:MAG: hypothetical protein SVR94_10520 [Pseudomonadota bacterium]|nr:hypothetical protein [Pseudomonadota bacterium]
MITDFEIAIIKKETGGPVADEVNKRLGLGCYRDHRIIDQQHTDMAKPQNYDWSRIGEIEL